MGDEKVTGSWLPSPARAGEPFDARELRSLRPSVSLRGRNFTKADILVYRLPGGAVAVKSYGRRPWPVRHTLGRWLVRREIAAYRALDGARGVPRFLGRIGPFGFAMEWIEARPLPELAPEVMSGEIVDRVGRVVEGIHQRGVAVADLHHRDCLVDHDGEAWIVDFATSVALGDRPGIARRWLFERMRQADLVGLARIRARFEGRDEDEASRAVGVDADAWYRRGRRLKRAWNSARGREDESQSAKTKRPAAPSTVPGYDVRLARLRVLAVWIAIACIVALSRPTAGSLAAGLPLVAAGEAIRCWAAGLLEKTVTLVTSGPYRFTRNPLYLGRLLIFAGLCVMAPLPAGAGWVVLAAGCILFFAYYLPRKERVEPARLREIHGERYERYRRAVPALWPALRPWSEPTAVRWSRRRFLANREHWMLIGLAAVTAFLAWRAGG